MPIFWKILSKRFLFNITLFTLFFIFITIFFKLSRLTKYFVSGADAKEVLLLLSIFIYKTLPFAISFTSGAAAFLSVKSAISSGELKAYSSLGINPVTLFHPLLFCSLFFSLLNLYTGFVFTPFINKSFISDLSNKKKEMHLLSHFSQKIGKDKVYLEVKEKNDTNTFLLIRDEEEFSWMVCDDATETKNGLTLHNPYYFVAHKEEEGFDSLLLKEENQTFVSRETIFSLFPKVNLEIDSIHYSPAQALSLSLYLLFPILFTMLGILCAIQKYKILSALAFFITFTVFTFTTVALYPITATLSSLTFMFVIPFYFFTMHTYKKGIL